MVDVSRVNVNFDDYRLQITRESHKYTHAVHDLSVLHILNSKLDVLS